MNITKAGSEPWYFTAVYASPDPSRRRELWKELKDFANTHKKPWLIAGDFNNTRFHKGITFPNLNPHQGKENKLSGTSTQEINPNPTTSNPYSQQSHNHPLRTLSTPSPMPLLPQNAIQLTIPTEKAIFVG